MSVKCILQGQETWRIPMKMISNPNLLLNWDFRKPVNRNGKTEYTNEWTYAIDRWLLPGGSALSIHDEYISLTASLDQILDYLPYGQYTASILTAAGLLTATATAATVDSSATIEVYVDLPTVGSLIFVPNNGWRLRIHPGPGYQNLIAAKLELGDHQTLARQNEDGEWELIDPVDYDTQYLLCSQYSPITGEWVGLQHSNTNLLDNWYFADSINQRGQTEYSTLGETRICYTIDRWVIGWDSFLKITDNGVVANGLYQPIDTTLGNKLKGQVVTISIIMDGQLYSSTGIYGEWIGTNTPSSIVPYGGHEFSAVFSTENKPCVAAKLELGPVQTLAHKEGDAWVLNDPPPDKALELLKCRRYYRHYDQLIFFLGELWGGVYQSASIIYEPMRTNPAVSIGGGSIANVIENLPAGTFGLYAGMDETRCYVKADALSGTNLTGKYLQLTDVVLDANL